MRPKMMFKLAKDGAHPFCDEGGATLGDGVALLEKDAYGRWSPRPQAQLESLLSLGYGGPVELSSRMGWLRQVAKYLNDGKVGKAGIALLHAQLLPLPSREAARRMAKADRLRKYDRFHVPGGATYAHGGEFDFAPNDDDAGGGASEPKKTPPQLATVKKPTNPERLAAKQAAQRAENETALKNPRVRAFLDTISWAEDADYDTLYGGKTFNSYHTHPTPSGDHTPAGRYQILAPTFRGLSTELGTDDFSPHTQDLMAVQILKAKGALDALIRKDPSDACRRVAPIWASLPEGDGNPGHYPKQPYKPYSVVHAVYRYFLAYHLRHDADVVPRGRYDD